MNSTSYRHKFDMSSARVGPKRGANILHLTEQQYVQRKQQLPCTIFLHHVRGMEDALTDLALPRRDCVVQGARDLDHGDTGMIRWPSNSRRATTKRPGSDWCVPRPPPCSQHHPDLRRQGLRPRHGPSRDSIACHGSHCPQRHSKGCQDSVQATTPAFNHNHTHLNRRTSQLTSQDLA